MEREERIERRFELPIVVAALLVIPIIVVEQASTGEPWSTLAAVGNWLVWLLFLAEVVVMLAVVPDRGRWLRTHPLEVAIVVLTPPFLPASLQALRVFRLLRLLRLIAAVRYARRVFTLDGLRYGALLALITVLAGGAAFAHAEGEEVSTWDGVWWAVTTMTTVGYGDIYPSTDTGRAVAILVMVVGIGFLSLLIGSVSERFVSGGVEEEVAEVERAVEADVERAEAEVLAEIRAIARGSGSSRPGSSGATAEGRRPRRRSALRLLLELVEHAFHARLNRVELLLELDQSIEAPALDVDHVLTDLSLGGELLTLRQQADGYSPGRLFAPRGIGVHLPLLPLGNQSVGEGRYDNQEPKTPWRGAPWECHAAPREASRLVTQLRRSSFPRRRGSDRYGAPRRGGHPRGGVEQAAQGRAGEVGAHGRVHGPLAEETMVRTRPRAAPLGRSAIDPEPA
jgi:voltage-gated potassium channel